MTRRNFEVNGLATDDTLFLAGDWAALAVEPVYDAVIGGDVTYDPSSYPALVGLLSRCLRPAGRAVIASKSLYFGNGGGLGLFEAAMAAAGFRSAREQVNTSGVLRYIAVFTRA